MCYWRCSWRSCYSCIANNHQCDVCVSNTWQGKLFKITFQTACIPTCIPYAAVSISCAYIRTCIPYAAVSSCSSGFTVKKGSDICGNCWWWSPTIATNITTRWWHSPFSFYSVSLVPRPSYCPVFDCLQYVIKNWTVGRPGNKASSGCPLSAMGLSD